MQPAWITRYFADLIARTRGLRLKTQVVTGDGVLHRDAGEGPVHRVGARGGGAGALGDSAFNGDAPVDGPRAVFLADIMNPCWIYESADLSHVSALSAAVGQAPFNFQIGDDVHKIPLHKPQTSEGELEVRLDRCDGERIAVLPLAPAATRNGVTTLPRVSIAPTEGKHDLCFTFTRAGVDPIWAIDSVQLLP